MVFLRQSFSVDCPGTHAVDQASLELIEIRLSLPSKCWG